MAHYGYVRVSTKDQNPERQLLAMQAYQIRKKNIYMDKMSGQDFVRPQYRKLLKTLKKGDLVIIKSIDRLGRNYDEILEQWRVITKEIGAHIEVIDMPLLNTNSAHNDLTGVFIADLALQILAYVAETERAFIKQRQAEGIAAAKRKGIRFGCRKKELPKAFEEYYQMWVEGRISLRKAAEALKMNHTTFYRRCIEYQTKMEKNCSKM
ncbi:putative transposon Tn552 DNA-invertase bin3 [Lachnospiraceae bacterium]|nr:putative transposon Tn552 DNA-invertase bin3 [Lachnospiraceae bacterium]